MTFQKIGKSKFWSKAKNACIVVKRFDFLFTHLFSGNNSVFLTLSTTLGEIIIGSTYIRPKPKLSFAAFLDE